MSRIGLGFDAHPFEPGRRLRLGGLEWDFDRGLSGHSDGDALLHAVSDALLGAAGAGTLGERFSDADPANAGKDSAEMLALCAREVAAAGYRIGNIDAVVIGQEPRLAPRREELTRRIASILEVDPARVSVRGTSSNGLGFPGRGDGLAAMAVVLLEEPHSGRPV